VGRIWLIFRHILVFLTARRIISMVTTALIIMTAIFWLITLIQSFKERARMEYLKSMDEYRNFQALAIKKYHPVFKNIHALSDLSVAQVREHFNITVTYNEIGKRPLTPRIERLKDNFHSSSLV
jgi:hypothetical protein